MMRTAAAKRGVSLTCMARIVENWLNFTENGHENRWFCLARMHGGDRVGEVDNGSSVSCHASRRSALETLQISGVPRYSSHRLNHQHDTTDIMQSRIGDHR
jgi:hypothetical protein